MGGKSKAKAPESLCIKASGAFLSGTPEGTRTPNIQNRKQYNAYRKCLVALRILWTPYFIFHHFFHRCHLIGSYFDEEFFHLYGCIYWRWFEYLRGPSIPLLR